MPSPFHDLAYSELFWCLSGWLVATLRSLAGISGIDIMSGGGLSSSRKPTRGHISTGRSLVDLR